MSETPICPCDVFQFPSQIDNLPGLDSIEYRIGDFVSFRKSLLMSLDSETELRSWRPDASEDLAVQMIEWWAYLADVLAFYNWRSANNSYLLTADQDDAVKGLIRLLGYRPRPGIGATGNVAALVSGFQSVNVPLGFQIQSKPSNGKESQMFEVDASVAVDPPVDFTAIKKSHGLLTFGHSLFLNGTIDSIKQGDQLLLVQRNWPSEGSQYKFITIFSTSHEVNVLGQPYTKIQTTEKLHFLSSKASDFRLVKSMQSISIWHFGDSSASLFDTVVHLVQLARTVRVKDHLLLSVDRIINPELIEVTAISDEVWYVNAPTSDIPAEPRADDTPSIAMVHSRIEFASTIHKTWDDTGEVLFDWREVGTLMPVPDTKVSGSSVTLKSVSGQFPTLENATVIIEDAEGNGAQGIGNVLKGSSSTIKITELQSNTETLKLPLELHIGSLDVSRGETVSGEVLGSGDAAQNNQEFTLIKSPVTYLTGSSDSGDGYSSTVTIWADGVQWQEVPTLYGQHPSAQVFVTFEDDDDMTHVRFGSPLPTGKDNIVATYRTGSGADVPDVGALSIIVNPIDGLSKIVSSSEFTPGSDPDPIDKIKTYAPKSILTFGRAVSGDDYEVIAAQAPGVTRARSYMSWDAKAQRATAVIYVGDTLGARDSARGALLLTADPNRPAIVQLADEIALQIDFTISVDPKYVPDDVETEVATALLDDDSGLFGVNVVQIGKQFFDSDIYAACHKVTGVKAVYNLRVTVAGVESVLPRHWPGEGAYFKLASTALKIDPEVETDVN